VSSRLARLVVKTAILLIHGRPRPYVVIETAHKLIPTSIAENFQSFPSGHTIFFFSLATVLYMFNKKLGVWFYVAALTMRIRTELRISVTNTIMSFDLSPERIGSIFLIEEVHETFSST
jgi:hypothetical protein